MAKVHVKKHSTFIDMTAMSDVTVLLLTFFMLTSTFVEKEPVTVTTPYSVSEIKVPDVHKLTILVDTHGKIFFAMDDKELLKKTAVEVAGDYGISFTPQELESFNKIASFGVPIQGLKNFLNLKGSDQDKFMTEALKDTANMRVGIPNSDTEVRDVRGVVSSDNEFKRWVSHAKELGGDNLILAIKADQTTKYDVIKKVIDDMRKMRENRYLLVTNLRTASTTASSE
ncbi:MAG: biopolymer transporter ExbD [Dysgonamonadaceae bacterium]|jgi:biopolymer transport protein ExbD|nr:biopolymer transporter ExbD [Dysgonamonadaceae bacterium]